MSIKNEEEAVNSVSNIETYPSAMLKTALKRNNILNVNNQEYDDIKTMSEIDIIAKYNIKVPCLINNGNKFLLVSKT